MFKLNDLDVAALGPLQAEGMPPAGRTDATAAKATELGGNVNAAPFDIPVGRMAVLSDPGGAHFSVLKPQPPDS